MSPLVLECCPPIRPWGVLLTARPQTSGQLWSQGDLGSRPGPLLRRQGSVCRLSWDCVLRLSPRFVGLSEELSKRGHHGPAEDGTVPRIQALPPDVVKVVTCQAPASRLRQPQARQEA